jgi:hypothetical protein
MLVIWAIPDELSALALGAVSAGYGWGILVVGSLLLLVSGSRGSSAHVASFVPEVEEEPPPVHQSFWQRQVPSTKFGIIAGAVVLLLFFCLVVVFMATKSNGGGSQKSSPSRKSDSFPKKGRPTQ